MADKTTRIEVTAENAAQFGIIVPEGVPFEKIFDCEPLTGDQIKEHYAKVRDGIDAIDEAYASLQALMVDAARSRVALLILASAAGIIEEPSDG